MQIALKNYKRCLLSGDRHDLQVIFRLCQLWFEHQRDERINGALDEAFLQVPSHKFVPLVYQIASRYVLGERLPFVGLFVWRERGNSAGSAEVVPYPSRLHWKQLQSVYSAPDGSVLTTHSHKSCFISVVYSLLTRRVPLLAG